MLKQDQNISEWNKWADEKHEKRYVQMKYCRQKNIQDKKLFGQKLFGPKIVQTKEIGWKNVKTKNCPYENFLDEKSFRRKIAVTKSCPDEKLFCWINVE